MSHNFEPHAHFTDTGVLSVTDYDESTDHVVNFYFQQHVYPLVVDIYPNGVDPDNGLAVAIGGEDLFALRELLLSMPEELFVKPAPPIARWTKGDIVMVEEGVNGRVLAYYRHDDDFWRAAGTAMVWVDEEVSAWVDNEGGAINVRVVRQASAS